MELVVASSSVNDSIGCWDLHSGIEQLRYRSCASPPHGLLSVSQHFLASSQLRESTSSSSAPIFFWSWDKPQVQVKSFPAEPIGPLVSDSDGFYIIGGGPSGAIYLWQTASGKLLKKLNAHYRSVTCLTLSHDESLLISGSEDGSIKVWSLIMVFDDTLKDGEDICFISFSEHLLPVTSVISGPGLHDSIIISSSEDRTCKVWSLSKERLLRSITFPSIIDAIAMDPGEHVFYAGGRDGKIYVAALNAECHSVKNYGKFIMGHLSDHSKAITCLAFSTDGVTLVSGSEDGTVRVWNTRSAQTVRLFKHSKAPVSNVLIVRRSTNISQEHLLKPRSLDRYIDDEVESIDVILPRQDSVELNNNNYISARVMMDQIKELNHIKELQEPQKNASAGSLLTEVELRLEGRRWKKLCKDYRSTLVNELLNEDNLDGR